MCRGLLGGHRSIQSRLLREYRFRLPRFPVGPLLPKVRSALPLAKYYPKRVSPFRCLTHSNQRIEAESAAFQNAIQRQDRTSRPALRRPEPLKLTPAGELQIE